MKRRAVNQPQRREERREMEQKIRIPNSEGRTPGGGPPAEIRNPNSLLCVLRVSAVDLASLGRESVGLHVVSPSSHAFPSIFNSQ